MKDESLLNVIEKAKQPIEGISDLSGLIAGLRDKKIVMLGEASHGTHEYYVLRARLTRILMEDHGFDFVAVEGDWPACYNLNRHVKNYGTEKETYEVLQQFNRWPTWMWANWEVHEFAEWLRKLNENLSAAQRKGFYGLDVYSLWDSMDAIVEYLRKEDPEALETVKYAIQCFEPYRDDEQGYAYSTRLVPEGCQSEVGELLQEILRKAPVYNTDTEHVLSVRQNAFIAKNAEAYYRMMVSGEGNTWNLRDRHMMDTLGRLLDFHGKEAKAIVWAHNTHIGDARYTDMARAGMFNIGQLARESYGEYNVSLVGFGSWRGTVMAGSGWGAKPSVMEMPEARQGSLEDLLHQIGGNFMFDTKDVSREKFFQGPVPHRAIGVVYHPEREKFANYVPSVVPKRYDAFIYVDETKVLHAIPVGESKGAFPETYPFGV